MATRAEVLTELARLSGRFPTTAITPEHVAAYLEDLAPLDADVLARACADAREASPAFFPPAPLIRHHAALILAGHPPEPHAALAEIGRMREETRELNGRAWKMAEAEVVQRRREIAQSCHPLVLAAGDQRRWWDLTGDVDTRLFIGLYAERRAAMIQQAARTGQRPALVAAFARAALTSGAQGAEGRPE